MSTTPNTKPAAAHIPTPLLPIQASAWDCHDITREAALSVGPLKLNVSAWSARKSNRAEMDEIADIEATFRLIETATNSHAANLARIAALEKGLAHALIRLENLNSEETGTCEVTQNARALLAGQAPTTLAPERHETTAFCIRRNEPGSIPGGGSNSAGQAPTPAKEDEKPITMQATHYGVNVNGALRHLSEMLDSHVDDDWNDLTGFDRACISELVQWSLNKGLTRAALAQEQKGRP